MNKLSKILIILSIVFMIFAVFACGGEEKKEEKTTDTTKTTEDTSKTPDAKKMSGPITFWAMPNAPDEVHVPWLEERAKEFEAETGVKVNIEIVGWGDAWQKIATSVATGEGVDAFQVGTTWNPQFAATGGLEELNINDFGGKSAFIKASLDSATYKGTIYGIPWFAETRILFYNTEMFDKAGVKPPKTQDELIEVGKKITEVYGEGTAISLAGTNAWDLLHNWSIILWSRGGSLLNSNNTKATFNGPEGIEAMRWYVKLFEEGLASKACAEYTQPQADAAFINGNVAMCYMHPGNIANIEQDNPDLPYSAVEPPAGPKGKASFAGGSNLVVLKGSKHKEAAKAWVKFLVDKQNLVPYTKVLTHMLPAELGSYTDSYYSTDPVIKTFKTTIDYATAYPPLGVWGDIENAVQSEFKNVLADYATGKFTEDTIENYLDNAAKRVDAALANEK